jgi:hypothetical protein
VVLQAFLTTPVKRATGIEILPALHQEAADAKTKVARDFPELFKGDRQLHFILGSFLEIPFNDATVVLVSSPCFTPMMLTKLAKIIDHTKSIHTVISLRPLISMQRLAFEKIVRIEGSWDSILCYIYTNKAH